MRIEQALQQAERLADVSDSARLDLELLLCDVLQQPRSYLFTWPERELTPAQQIQFEQAVARRAQGEPVAHITGRRAFWTLELEVSPDTLIPRPDTETLVEQVLLLLADGDYSVADLGTGTGAIALALASERPRWRVTGCDRIEDAVALARRNAQRLGIGNADFVLGSWFEPLQGPYDLIVSNPPYIDPDDEHLGQGDVRFEPLSALTADEQGMADIRQIATQARDFLKPGGWLLFEHGYDQGERARHLLHTLGYTQIGTVQDLGGRDRITCGCWTGESDDVE